MTATAVPAESPDRVPIDVQIATAAATPPDGRIESWARGALGHAAAAEAGELCLRVVDEAESERLNHQFRSRKAPTNVLSFPADVTFAVDPDEAAAAGAAPLPCILGDVVICAPVVLREAAAQGKAYEDHFAHMVVHGVLHLLGYDHVSAGEAERMERLEIEILERFGVSDPYGEG